MVHYLEAQVKTMKNSEVKETKNIKRSALVAATLAVGLLSLTASANPIRQYGDSGYEGYATWHVHQSWDGIGAASGLQSRSRIVSKNVHATPDFVIQGSPYSLQSDDVELGVQTSNAYGHPSSQPIRIFTRVVNSVVTVDPFETLRVQSTPSVVLRAQREFLTTNGYVEVARIVRKVPRGSSIEIPNLDASNKKAVPTPRATIEIHPGLNDQPDLPLEVKASEIETNLAQLINGTITVTRHSASDDQQKLVQATRQ